MPKSEVIDWLLYNSSQVVRFRTLTELIRSQDIDRVSHSTEELLSSNTVKYWLNHMQYKTDFNAIHGSKPHVLENFLNKLRQLGLKAGLQVLDGKTLRYRAWLSKEIENPPESFLDELKRTIVAASLANAGYGEIGPVDSVLESRLTLLYESVVESDWTDPYTDASNYSIPKSRRKWNLLHADHYRNGFSLPWIYDLIGFARAKQLLTNPTTRKMLDLICKAILNPSYQRLPKGYGLVRSNGRFYVSGWSVHLPGFGFFRSKTKEAIDTSEGAQLLLWLELLSPLPTIRNSDWFKSSLSYLEKFQTHHGTYLFPKNWLNEKTSGYWVNGSYMALKKGRRKKKDIEAESTFRMLKLKRQLSEP